MKAIIITLAMVSTVANAKLTLDTGTGDTTFKVNGKTVSAVDAMQAAIAGQTVYKCKPKDAKGKNVYFGKDGSAVGSIVECKPQEAKVNAKTGNVSFKAAKN